ncbi:OmpH family outer membrane protein [Winogradskyella aquimaris]|uniref:OmpH family outer membrane protein n=1 Tax=Winogradskyella aquimaris TaxID=864074 RepID=A0ABU5ELS1_9FLAO|nr:OmpH family outer membrane protein [Winogradskyella aquimaris]MDY2586503.1 OmpH family outer membrane protein [Winogradskyella aquimaris]
MKNILVALLVLVTLSACQEQEKVAFVDNSQVIDDYQMKIDIEKKYEDQNNAFNKQRDSIGRVYQMEIQTIQMQLGKMSQRNQEEESQKFQQKWQPIQQQLQYRQQQMEQNFNVEMDSVINKVNDFVEEYGKNNDYTFIFGKNRAGSVLYGTESKDITEAVTKAINEAYKKGDKTEESKPETSDNAEMTEKK